MVHLLVGGLDEYVLTAAGAKSHRVNVEMR